MHDRLVGLRDALCNFIDARETQSQSHIRLLHWHIAERLVIEGGFHPDSVVPRPPLRVETIRGGTRQRHRLIHDPDAAVDGEMTILGGLKTKNVDVVTVQPGVGPCIAVSVKGTLNAFRNLTNRMEEAAGDCTNIHIAYPNLVYGFFHVIKAGRERDVDRKNDMARRRWRYRREHYPIPRCDGSSHRPQGRAGRRQPLRSRQPVAGQHRGVCARNRSPNVPGQRQPHPFRPVLPDGLRLLRSPIRPCGAGAPENDGKAALGARLTGLRC